MPVGAALVVTFLGVLLLSSSYRKYLEKTYPTQIVEFGVGAYLIFAIIASIPAAVVGVMIHAMTL